MLSAVAMPARALPVQHHLLATLALKILLAFEGACLLAAVCGMALARRGGFARGFRGAALAAVLGFALSWPPFSG